MKCLLDEVREYTKSPPKRLEAMVTALRHIDQKGIKGDVVECGVWMAGNIILARKVSPSRVCWLYDTFAGMPEPGPLDGKRRKKLSFETLNRWKEKKANGTPWSAASEEQVKVNLIKTGTFDETKLRFVKGMVEETLLREENLPDRIALLRLDTDWYSSTKIELERLYPRLQQGGILIVDDYGHWHGANKAVDDYFARTNPRKVKIDYTAIMITKGERS